MKKLFIALFALFSVTKCFAQTDTFISDLTETTAADSNYVLIVESPTTTYKIKMANFFKIVDSLKIRGNLLFTSGGRFFLPDSGSGNGQMWHENGLVKFKFADTTYVLADTGFTKTNSDSLLPKNNMWTGLNQFSQDSIRFNGLWYVMPSSYVANSMPYDSLGNGVLKWKAFISADSTIFYTRYAADTTFLKKADSTIYLTPWDAATAYVPLGRTISTTSPLSGGGDLSGNRTLSIADAVADGSTKGAASFTSNDFNSSSGNISIDYTNGQAASVSTKGFLSSADWTTFNNKQATLTFNYPLSLSGTTVSMLYAYPLVLNGSNYLAVDYNTTNLKLTFNKLNTIQDIATTSSPTFAGLTLNGNLVQSGNYSIYNNFTSGWAGAGFRLDYGVNTASKSELEIDNLTVRGTLSVYELLLRQIRATNGAIFVSASAKVESVVGTTITFEDPSATGLCPFAAGDLLIVQRYKPNGTTVLRSVQATVSSVSGNSVVVSYTSGTFAVGDEVVRVGNTSTAARQNSIYMTSDDSNSPFMDMITSVNSWSAWASASKTKLRLGNLTGITDAIYGALSGYGLYADNVYLKGAILASSGAIGGWNINSTSMYTGTEDHSGYTTNAGDITIYSNGSDASIHAKNFYIDTNGDLTATSATLTGTVNATAGYFGTASNYWGIGATGLTATASSGDVVIKYGKTDFGADATNGFIFGYDYSASKPKFEIGSSASKLFKYDGTDLSLTGGTITGGTIQTATGTGQRVIVDNTNGGQLRFYNSSDANIVKIGDNVSSGYSGILVTNGAIYSSDAVTGLPIFGSTSAASGIGVIGDATGVSGAGISGTATGSGTVSGGKFVAGGSGTNYGVYATASLGASNYALYTYQGDASFNAGKFYINSSGQLTKVNNMAPTSGYALIGDGTSFTPRAIASTDINANVSSTEFGYLDGVTSAIQTQINGKQATITGAATSITSSNLTASKIAVSDASGKVAVSGVASSELFTPAYGQLYDAVGTSTITCNGTGYVKWTGSTVGQTKGVTGNTTSDNLTIDSGQDGKYLVQYNVTFKGSVATNYYWTVNVGGAAKGEAKQLQYLPTTTDNYNISGSAILSLSAADTIDLGCLSTNTNVVTVLYASLTITKLSN